MKIVEYLKSDRSDRMLLVIVIILVNLVSAGWFVRLDLTAGNTYSLSSVSRRTISSLQEPLTVSVFFSPDLPAPYNGVSRYLKDLLAEYGAVGNSNFRYRFIDVESDEGRRTAESYGIASVQVREVRSDEFQSRNVYMGIALSYGSAVEQLREVTSPDGLEYRLTTTISRMVNTVGAAAGLERRIKARLYYSPVLGGFGIGGFDDLEQEAASAVAAVNAANNDILEFEVVRVVGDAEAAALSGEYGLQRISFPDSADPEIERAATVGMVLELDERFKTLPLDLAPQLFGGYVLTGLTNLEQRISQALEGLLNENPPVGYLTGHGERDLADSRNGAALFRTLNEDLYEFIEIDPAEDEIPLGVSTLVINSPKAPYTRKELYTLDQFLLRGGSLLIFLDPFQIVEPRQDAQPGMPPVYLPVESGLGELLENYGIETGTNYVLDLNSYKAQQQAGMVSLYHIPILEKESLDQKHPVTRNLGQVVFLASSAVRPAAKAPEGVTLRTLAFSSDKSWIMEGDIDLNPMTITPPAADKLERYPLLVLAEGNFPSFFSGPLEENSPNGQVQGTRYLGRSISSGKIIVAGTSELTGPQLLDPEGRSPNAILVHNMLDYVNGNEELPLMRSKGLNLIPLKRTSPEYRSFVKGFAMAGLPLLVMLSGLLVWRLREARRRSIKALFESKEEVRV
jgi:gliding motility-associatede transport system auxiliary component